MDQVTGKLAEMRDGLRPGDPGFENAGKAWDFILTGIMEAQWTGAENDAENGAAEISRQWPERCDNRRTHFQNGMRDDFTGGGPDFDKFDPRQAPAGSAATRPAPPPREPETRL